MFVRRLGPGSTDTALACRSTFACPDIWEMDNGDFAVIGTDITEYATKLPPTAGCAANERMVRIPRLILVLAKADIPDQV